MMSRFVFSLAILYSFSVSSQSTRFLLNLDTTYSAHNSYIENYTLEEYYASGAGDKQIEYGTLESELLNAAVFFALNKERQKRRKTALSYDPHLDYLAYNCTHYFSKSKFRYSKRNDLLYERNLYLAARYMPMKCHLFSANTSLTPIMEVDPKRKIHKNLEDPSNPYGLYYRSPPELKDEPEEAVEVMTYNEFALKVVESLYSRKTRRRLISKSYEVMACYVYIEPRSMNRNKPPYAKVIQIMGARRLVKG